MNQPIDLDALMAQVRERIREKREKGIYGPDVEALLRVPLSGGRRIFSDDLQDPLASLAEVIDEEVESDPRGRKPSTRSALTGSSPRRPSTTGRWRRGSTRASSVSSASGAGFPVIVHSLEVSVAGLRHRWEFC